MTTLTIKLLGGLTLERDGRHLTSFKTRKAEALIVYLVCQPRPLAREALASFFWNDSEPKQAQANLRKVLTDCRQHVDDFLIVDRQSISFNFESDYWLDTVAFEKLLDSADDVERQEQAVALYKGDFLAGFYLRDSVDFDKWALLARERYRLQAGTLLERLTEYNLHHRLYQKGIQYAQQLLALDPLNEKGHRLFMRLLARSGQRSAALAQYAECERLLAEELDVPPMPETTAVYQRICQLPERPVHFPLSLLPLIGRQAEMAQISQQLDEPGGQLITLVGPGGSGKTRLALAATADLSSDFRDGVYLINLSGYSPKEDEAPQTQLVTAVANALGILFTGAQAAEQQLKTFLQEKELLLLLDNFEQFQTVGSFVASWMAAAPGLSLCITSRQPLGVSQEWVLEVGGLPFPPLAASPAEIADFASVQLFNQQARRVRPDFMLTDANQQAVAQICALLGGLPLGIELAATAVRAFSPDQIVQQLMTNLDFLATRARDMPVRHRSARAIFEYAWALLNGREQAQFRRLTIFRGNFTLAAAVSVAELNPATLLGLVNKSMLWQDASGRYQMHELLRQYGAEKREQHPGEDETVSAAHGRFLGTLLHEQHGRLHGPEQKAAIETIRADLDNILAAWQWAVRRQATGTLQQMLPPLHRFYTWHGRYQEGIDLYQFAINQLQQNEETAVVFANLHLRRAIFLSNLAQHQAADDDLEAGWALVKQWQLEPEAALAYLCGGLLAYNTSRFADAATALADSLAAYQALPDTIGEATAYYQLGSVHLRLNQYEKAQQFFEESLLIQGHVGNRLGQAQALTGLASVFHSWMGDYEQAEIFYQQSLAIRRELGDVQGTAVTLNQLASLACDQGHLQLGIQYYEESLALRRQIGAPLGLAVVLGNLGTIYYELAEYEQARTMYEESMSISQRIGDDIGMAFTLANLAELAQKTGRYDQARSLWRQSLQLGLDLALDDRMLFGLYGVAALWLIPDTAVYNSKKGKRLLHFVVNHPSCTQDIKAQAANLVPDILTLSLPDPETRALTAVATEMLESL